MAVFKFLTVVAHKNTKDVAQILQGRSCKVSLENQVVRSFKLTFDIIFLLRHF